MTLRGPRVVGGAGPESDAPFSHPLRPLQPPPAQRFGLSLTTPPLPDHPRTEDVGPRSQTHPEVVGEGPGGVGKETTVPPTPRVLHPTPDLSVDNDDPEPSDPDLLTRSQTNPCVYPICHTLPFSWEDGVTHIFPTTQCRRLTPSVRRGVEGTKVPFYGVGPGVPDQGRMGEVKGDDHGEERRETGDGGRGKRWEDRGMVRN